MSAPLSIFAACAPGLEPWLARELERLGAPEANAIAGGVEFPGDRALLYRLNLWSGLASHVRVRVGRFEARHFSSLVKQASRLDWMQWVATNRPVEVRATSRRSKLYHTKAVEQRVLEAIDTAVGGVSAAEGTEPTVVHARLVRDRCELSVDTSGEGLHRRGWRQQTAKAPLREDLAHALLEVSGWQPSMSLIDPMMGSGTLVIEAARIARGMAPGRDRSFSFESMPGFDAALWDRLRDEARAQERACPVTITGRDRERGALEATRGNAGRAGVLDDLVLEQVDLRDGGLQGSQAVVCNPPYGRRVGRGRASEVAQTWQALGAAIREAPSVQTVALVVPDRALLRGTGLAVEPRLLTDHGGIKVEFMASAPSGRPD